MRTFFQSGRDFGFGDPCSFEEICNGEEVEMTAQQVIDELTKELVGS